MTRPWWQTTAVYQVYPRSFADGSGDGIGDLAGLIGRLDHLTWLGVGALWLSPINPSPMADFGYDVSDYCDVDPVFGSLSDVDTLVAEAHARGLKVLLDWVPNHSSDQHPWFLASRSSREDPKRSWYVWRDPAPGGGPPNNWTSTFTGLAPAWTWDEPTGQYYLHQFLPQQPDLNWDEPALVAAMHDTLRFWLDRGVDGFRIDVVHGLGRDLDRDDPPDMGGLAHNTVNHSESTFPIVAGIRGVVDAYADRTIVGEVFQLSTARIARYLRPGLLPLAFDFPFSFAPWDAGTLRRRVERVEEELGRVGAWPTWVLSNHDRPRHRTRLGGSEAAARAAAVLLLTLRGTPFLYQGEELGLEDAVVPPDRVVDPGGRDGCRAPLPWTADAASHHGWAADPWLPFPPEASTRSVEVQRADPASMLHLYRRLLHLRREHPALTGGLSAWLGSDASVLAFERAGDGERLGVAVNVGPEAGRCAALAGRPVLVASDGDGTEAGTPFTGTLAPDTAVVVNLPARRPLGPPVASTALPTAKKAPVQVGAGRELVAGVGSRGV